MSLLKVYWRVLLQLGPERRLGFILLVCNIALACIMFAEPILFGRIIDTLTRAQAQGRTITWPEILPLVSAWMTFGLFTIAAGVLVALHADRMSHRRRLAFMQHFFEHVLNLPLSYHSGTHSGRLLKQMLEGSNAMAWLLLSFLREHCASMIALVILVPVSLVVNWRLGSLLVIMVFLFFALTTYVLRKTDTLQGKVQEFHNALAERATDALGNVPVIQSFTRIDAEVRAMRATVDALLAAQIPVLSWWAVAAVASRASATLTVLSIFITGTWLHIHNLATIGEIVTFMGFATMLIARLEAVVGFVNSVFMEGPKIKDFFDVIDTAPLVHDRANAIDIGRAVGTVAFENVTFSYDGKRPAVADLTFLAAPGDTIALVGSTGSGKSTTLSLLHRVFDPQSGRVTIDGNDIREISLVSLRRNIGVVFQEPMLFARTIRENLQVGRPDATNEEIMEACERAQAAEFLARQPEGLDTEIAERGRSLSGGERQRLSIARALLKNPPVLILDEATSALDATTEQKLQVALEEVMKGRTTFVIAHRLATIRHATRILVFDQGRVVESGTFDELVAQGGIFANLAKAQFMTGDATKKAPVPPLEV
ncbi:glucan ABC transporter ATP-binding protein/ permease [Phreatobacter aquaticus]|uniref:Glucan ABC transporter ATP-binding protein/ permease n=1 Tax=Phreatobacter aquaticus TaxID=2570229 RepID=A0A4D7QLK8_9HYPH|nr:glucan ABC transporter ATP-binding protein/ permease [Phreatobacter aquaticus]QCK85152.1 glucan ABC transporter ATP-binding protein/ permease [Phreatobacter aquaticus]